MEAVFRANKKTKRLTSQYRIFSPKHDLETYAGMKSLCLSGANLAQPFPDLCYPLAAPPSRTVAFCASTASDGVSKGGSILKRTPYRRRHRRNHWKPPLRVFALAMPTIPSSFRAFCRTRELIGVIPFLTF